MQQLVPRKIQAPSLKKQEIVGAAASTIHSVVYTQTDLFTFGYNKGQLGRFTFFFFFLICIFKKLYINKCNSCFLFLIMINNNNKLKGYHVVGDDVRQVSPRKVALNNKIKQVVAIVSNERKKKFK